MWFWGLLLGALIGATTFSLEYMLVCAAVGAVVFFAIGKARAGKARDLPPRIEEDADETTLQERVRALEERVAVLERRAATGTERAVADAAGSTTDDLAPDTVAPLEPASIPVSILTLRNPPEPSAEQAPAASAALEPVDLASAGLDAALLSEAEADTPAPRIVAPLAPPPPRLPLRDRLPAPLAALIFGGNLLVKAGVLILFLGLAFLLRYTAERVTVPVGVRYASVGALGAVLLAIGWVLRRRRAAYALTLQGAGIGVLYLTTLAAMKLQPLLPTTAGFAFLFAVAVLAALLAVLQDAPVLAIVATLGGFAAPVLAASGQHDAAGLFTYLLVLDAGIFVVAWFRAWRLLNLIGAVGTFALASGWANQWYDRADFGVVQTFLIVFFVLFAAIGLLFARRTLAEAPDDAGLSLADRARRSLGRVGRVDSALVFGVPMAAYGLEYLLVRPFDLGPAIAALAFGAFYLLLGRLVFATQPRGLALLAEAYAIVGAIFATLAIPLALEGRWSGSAWAIEAAGMYWLGQRQQRPYARGFAFLLLGGASVQLLRSTGIDLDPGTPALRGSLLAPLLVAAGAFAIAALHRRASDSSATDGGGRWESLAATTTPWIGLAALALLPWQTLMPMPACAASALLGLVAYALGGRLAFAALAMAGLALQATVLVGFIGTLRPGGDASGAALAGGATGLASAAVLAFALLASGALTWRTRFADANRRGTAVRPSAVLIACTLGGIALLHLALLLGTDWPHAAFWWTFGALVSLWLALRLRLPALAGLAALIHVAAGVAVLGAEVGPGAPPFAYLRFWTALALGVTALVAADRLRAAARQAETPGWTAWAPVRWASVRWAPLVWGSGW